MSEAENIAASGCKMDNQDGISEPLSRKSEEVDQLRAEVEKLRRERAQERLVVGNIISAVPGLCGLKMPCIAYRFYPMLQTLALSWTSRGLS